MKPKLPRIILGVTAPMSIILMKGLPERLAESGWDVHVVAAPGDELTEMGASQIVKVHAIPMVRKPSLGADLSALVAWVRLIRRIRPDLVFVGTPKAGMLAMFAAFLVGVKQRVYHVRGLRLETAHGAARWIYYVLERGVLAAATSAVVVSSSLRTKLVELRLASEGKLVTLGRGSSNGVDTVHFHPKVNLLEAEKVDRAALATEIPTIGYVGRLHSDKGIGILIEASNLLTNRGVGHRLLIIGGVDDKEGARYHEMISALPHPVSLIGAVADPAPYYHQMTVLCLPSFREGFPNVVLEAASSGVPTVTTDATGAFDSVINGETGFVVPVGDATALAEKLEIAISDERWRATAARQARLMVEKDYCRPVVQERLVDYLSRLVDRNDLRSAAAPSESHASAVSNGDTQIPAEMRESEKPRWSLVWGDIRGLGGTESRMIAVSQHLDLNGIRARFLIRARDSNSQFVEAVDAAGVEYDVASSWWSLARAVRRHSPTTIWTFGLKQSLFLRLLRVLRVYSAPTFMARNGLDFGWPSWMFRSDRLSQKYVDAYVTNSVRAAEHLTDSGIQKRKVHFVSSGISEEWLENRKSRVQRSILMVGNSRPEKNQAVALRAFLESNIDTTLTIYTDQAGPLRELMDSYESTAHGRVELVEGVRVTPEVYDAAGILLHPSLSESLPLAVLEATARGCHVVASDVGDIGAIVPIAQLEIIDPQSKSSIISGLRAANTRVSADDYERPTGNVKGNDIYSRELIDLVNRVIAHRDAGVTGERG